MPPRCVALPLSLWVLTGCLADGGDEEKSPAAGDQEILAIGDSLLDFHGEGDDVPYVVADALERTIESVAMGGTTMLGGEGLDIPRQYVEGTYGLLLASGGGNDLAECTCGRDCDPIVDAIISEDGMDGAVPELVNRAIAGDAKVAWVGYFRPMPDAEAFSACTGEQDELVERLALLDAAEPDMLFVDGTQYGTGVESDLYAEDGYHPSLEGSALLGERTASLVAEAFAF